MRIINIIGISLTVLLLVSCGLQQNAKSLVKDFVEDCLHQDADYLDFTSVDSTRTVTDSVIIALRQQGPEDVPYVERKGRTLLFIRAKYLVDKDTLSATFYLDSDLTGVVAYKQN
jgi:hypothetical protein